MSGGSVQGRPSDRGMESTEHPALRLTKGEKMAIVNYPYNGQNYEIEPVFDPQTGKWNVAIYPPGSEKGRLTKFKRLSAPQFSGDGKKVTSA
jgi:hypothetical protein